MPIYEYTCGACGAEFEELVQSSAAERKLRCVKCRSKEIKRRLSVPAAPHVATASRPAPGPCGRCGESPDACPFK